MGNRPAGSLWLKQILGLTDFRLTHRSVIGPRNKIEMALDGGIEQVYGPKYAPAEDSIPEHIEFLLKYDDLSLDFLHAVFRKADEAELIAYWVHSPARGYIVSISGRLHFLIGIAAFTSGRS